MHEVNVGPARNLESVFTMIPSSLCWRTPIRFTTSSFARCAPVIRGRCWDFRSSRRASESGFNALAARPSDPLDQLLASPLPQSRQLFSASLASKPRFATCSHSCHRLPPVRGQENSLVRLLWRLHKRIGAPSACSLCGLFAGAMTAAQRDSSQCVRLKPSIALSINWSGHFLLD